LLFIVSVCLLSSCKKINLDGEVMPSDANAESLRASPDSLQIGNNIFLFTAYLYRDFMPTVPQSKDGKGLATVIALSDKNNIAFPADLQLRKQYIVYLDQIWTDNFNDIYQYLGVFNAVTRNGPHWTPGTFVDLICEFVTGNKTYRIILRHQEIIEVM
jgi:hypothetical protein